MKMEREREGGGWMSGQRSTKQKRVCSLFGVSNEESELLAGE